MSETEFRFSKPVVKRVIEKHIAPNWILLLLIAAIPLQNIYLGKLPSLGAGINFLNVSVLLSYLVSRFRSDFAPRTSVPINRLIIAYAVLYVFSMLWGAVYLGELGDGHFKDLKDHIIPFVIYFTVLHSVRDRRGVIWIIVATLLPLPYMFRVFYSQLGGVARGHYDDDLRLVAGTFSQLGSNEVAAFYAAYSLVLIGIFIFIKNTKVRVVLAFMLALNLYSLLYTHSRGGWLAFLGGGLFILLHFNRKLAIIAVLSIVFVGGPMLTVMPASVQERFGTIFVEEGEERDKSAESRFELWAEAWDAYKTSPVLGVGYHVFHHVGASGKDTHNYFVKVGAEQGPIGIILLAFILGHAMRSSQRLYAVAQDPLYKGLALGMIGSVTALVIANMTGDRFSYYPLITYFWTYLALVQRCLILSKDRVATQESVT